MITNNCIITMRYSYVCLFVYLQYFDVAGRSIPLGYMGTSEDVVPTVVFLASDKAEFVTGAVIAVDGGYVCTCCMP